MLTGLFITAVASTTLTATNKSDPDIVRIEFDNHKYIQFTKSNSLFVLHDPDCRCQGNNDDN